MARIDEDNKTGTGSDADDAVPFYEKLGFTLGFTAIVVLVVAVLLVVLREDGTTVATPTTVAGRSGDVAVATIPPTDTAAPVPEAATATTAPPTATTTATALPTETPVPSPMATATPSPTDTATSTPPATATATPTMMSTPTPDGNDASLPIAYWQEVEDAKFYLGAGLWTVDIALRIPAGDDVEFGLNGFPLTRWFDGELENGFERHVLRVSGISCDNALEGDLSVRLDGTELEVRAESSSEPGPVFIEPPDCQ